MQKGDKVLCRITNYIPRERTFEVEELVSRIKGFVIIVNNYQDIPILKEAYKKGKNIPLYFDRYKDGNVLFSYKEKRVEHIEEKPKVEIKALFSGTDRDFNISLFDALFNSIGEVIDSDEKYNLAKQLLIANKELKVRGGGTLKINLKWNTTDDLDLHVFDPDGFEIYYGQKEHVCDGVKVQLDIDANAGSPYTRTPQENIYWEEGKNAPIGRSKVQVVLYSKRDTIDMIPFTVTVYPDKGETKIFTEKVGVEKTPKDIVCFEYSENGITYL